MSNKKPTDKKMISVMVTESLHRKVKVMAELEGESLSDLLEKTLESMVKRRLPGLLANLTEPEVPIAAE